MSPIARSSLPEQLVKAITNDIADGTWTKQLPGYRILGKRYNVSRTTCDKALQILEANGVIGPAKPGKMRAILSIKGSSRVSTSRHLLIIIDRLHPPTPLDEELLMQIENLWKTEGGDVIRVGCDLMRIQKPRYLLEKWINKFNTDCLLFDAITYDWIEPVESKGLPCYALGGSVANSHGILSGSGFRIVSCITNLLREVLESGHRNILLTLARATPEKEMRRGIQKMTEPILTEDWGGDEISFSLMIPDLVDPIDWQNWWSTTLLRDRPTVVLTDSVFQALCIHNFCLENGIQMPRDMSVVIMDDAEFLEWLNPPPTRYRYQKEEGFRHFRDWMQGGFPKGSLKFFGAELAGGKTLGPAPKPLSKT